MSLHTLLFLYTICPIFGGAPPNEFGDFLAGAFAPLAFLWLAVAVFFQRAELSLQRTELEHNREALKLQDEELRRTVEENAAQAKSLEASKEYSRQDIIIRVSETGLRTLSSVACTLWHQLYRVYRHANYDQTNAYWTRFADGDREIWFAALVEALDRPELLQKARQDMDARESASLFENECQAIQDTLSSFDAPEHLIASFDQGLVGQVRSRLSKLGEST